MLTLLSLEVNYLILPACVLFFLFVVPIPGVSRFICRAVSFIEQFNFYGVSLLLLLTFATALSFALQFMDWRKKYGYGKPRFVDLSLEVEWEAKKWRLERNMYIHALATVLCSAIMRFSRLYRQLEKQKVTVATKKKTA